MKIVGMLNSPSFGLLKADGRRKEEEKLMTQYYQGGGHGGCSR